MNDRLLPDDAKLKQDIERSAGGERNRLERFEPATPCCNTPYPPGRRSSPATMSLGAIVGAIEHAREELDAFILQLGAERDDARATAEREATWGHRAAMDHADAIRCTERTTAELEAANRTIESLVRAEQVRSAQHTTFAEACDERETILEAQVKELRRALRGQGYTELAIARVLQRGERTARRRLAKEERPAADVPDVGA